MRAVTGRRLSAHRRSGGKIVAVRFRFSPGFVVILGVAPVIFIALVVNFVAIFSSFRVPIFGFLGRWYNVSILNSF